MLEAVIGIVGVVAGLVLGWTLAQTKVKSTEAIHAKSAEEAKAREDAARKELGEVQVSIARLEGLQDRLVEAQEQLGSRERRIEELTRHAASLDVALKGLDGELEQTRQSSAAEVARISGEAELKIKAKDEWAFERVRDAEAKANLTIPNMRDSFAEQRRLLEDAEAVLKDKFGAISLDSLKSAQDTFVKLAQETFDKNAGAAKEDLEKRRTAIDQLVKPLGESLSKLEEQTRQMELKREAAFSNIEKGIATLSQEADQLANALRKPTSRGAWGEQVLQTILDNMGLIQNEHYLVQSTTDGEDGRLRADFVIILPNKKQLVIDSKAPMDAFWEGMNAPDEATRTIKFQAHARAVRDHVNTLKSKSYWAHQKASPECIIMFMPTEGSYQAALEHDPKLISDAHQHRVYIANPMSVMSIVHVVGYIMSQEAAHQSAEAVRDAGRELYERMGRLVESIALIGKSLDQTQNRYNDTIRTLDARVLPSLKRMKLLKAGSEEIAAPPELETTLREPVKSLADLPKGTLSLPFDAPE